MISVNRALCILLPTLLGPMGAYAQLFPEHSPERGGGSLVGCDPSLQVDFDAQILGGYGYLMVPNVQEGETYVLNSVWSSFSDVLVQSYDPELNIGFPGPGEYPVCLTVNALDAGSFAPCSTSTCKLIEALPDSICLDLVADFTISGVAGSEITFVELGDITSVPYEAQWVFEDGAVSVGPTATHPFAGPGPHRVCMTLVGGPPTYCSSSVCKWLYIGPGTSDCDLFMEPGFIHYNDGQLVGVLDTSSTSGLDHEVAWDFGDGTVSTGQVALHAYEQPGYFNLCRTLRMWGPMLTDTCVTTECVDIFTYPSTAVDEVAGAMADWSASPVPTASDVRFKGPWVNDLRIRVLDLSGRTVQEFGPWPGSNGISIDLSPMSPGIYLAELRSQEGTHVIRVVRGEQ